MSNWSSVIILAALVLVSFALLKQKEEDHTTVTYYHGFESTSESETPAVETTSDDTNAETVRYYDKEDGWVEFPLSKGARVYNYDYNDEECDESGFCLFRARYPSSELDYYEDAIEISKDEEPRKQSGVINSCHMKRLLHTADGEEEWIVASCPLVYDFDFSDCRSEDGCFFEINAPIDSMNYYEDVVEISKDESSHPQSGVIHPRKYARAEADDKEEEEKWIYIDFPPPTWTTIIHLDPSACGGEKAPLFEINAPLDELFEDTVEVGRDAASSAKPLNSGIVRNRGSSNAKTYEFKNYRYFANGTFAENK